MKSLGLGSVIDGLNEKVNAGGTYPMHPELKTNPINQIVLNLSYQQQIAGVAMARNTEMKGEPMGTSSEVHSSRFKALGALTFPLRGEAILLVEEEYSIRVEIRKEKTNAF